MAKKKETLKEEEKDLVKVENKADKKKLLKEIDDHVKEKKEELTKDIGAAIEEQINFQVSKRMKEEEKRIVRGKSGKIIRRDIIIILLLAVIGYFGYCLYDVDYYHIRTKEVEKKEPVKENNENNNQIDNNDKENDKPVVDEHDAAYYIENFGYLVDNLQINDTEVFNLYTKKVTNKNISNSLKLKIAYYNLDNNLKTKDSNDMITLKPNDLLASAQKIFGNDITINNEVFSYNNTKFMFYNDTYLGFYNADVNNNLVYKIINAKEKDNNLTFDVVVAKKQDNSLLNLKDKVIVEDYDDNLVKYLEELPKYQITFEKQGENYIFNSIKSL